MLPTTVRVMTVTIRLPVRDVSFALEDVPRHWVEGNPVWTHLGNRLLFVVPELERLLIHALRNIDLSALTDPEAQLQWDGFLRQEASHARHHQAAFEMLRRHGYEVDTLLARLREMSREFAARHSQEDLLSIFAGIEHHLATFGRWWLVADPHPTLSPGLQELVRWHAAEELEHQTVAYDVYVSLVAPTWSHRVLGWIRASQFAVRLMNEASRHLLAQDDPPLRPSQIGRQLIAYAIRHSDMVAAQLLNLARYLRPAFHPLDYDSRPLAAAYFQEHNYSIR